MSLAQCSLGSLSIHILPSSWPSNSAFRANLENTHAAYVNGCLASISKITFFPLFFFDAIPSELSSHMVLSWQRWRCGYGRLHTNLMLRPLQMTRDTSSDDIFFQLFPSWMASAAPCKHPSTTPNNKPPIRALTPWFLVTMAPQPPAVTWLTPLSRCWIWSNHSQSSLNISFFKQRAQNFVIQSPDQSPITQSSQSRLIRREPFQERQLGDETRDLQKGVNLLWSEALFVSRL